MAGNEIQISVGDRIPAVLSTVTDLINCAFPSHYSVQCDIRPILFVRHSVSSSKPLTKFMLNFGSLFVVYTKIAGPLKFCSVVPICLVLYTKLKSSCINRKIDLYL
jgi:hypothetical protein